MVLTKLRNVAVKCHVGPFMAATIMFVSCTKDKTVAKLSTPKTSQTAGKNARIQSITNEDFFRGLMFLDGPVTSYLGDYSVLNISAHITDPKQRQAATDYENNIMTQIEAANPGYLEAFRENVSSGDYASVEKYMIEAATKVQDIAASSMTQTPAQYNQEAANFITKYNITKSSSPTDIYRAMQSATTNFVCVDVYVLVQIAAVVEVAIVVGGVLFFPVMQPYNPASLDVSTFQTQEYLSTLTTNLQGV